MANPMDGLGKLWPTVTSSDIESALKVFDVAADSVKTAEIELDYCDKKTQDLLHEMEMLDLTYHNRAHTAIDLTKVRQRRRAAKDIIDQLTPLIEWTTQQKPAVDRLRQCLGKMRNIEEKQKNRVYYMRAGEQGEFITADKEKVCGIE